MPSGGFEPATWQLAIALLTNRTGADALLYANEIGRSLTYVTGLLCTQPILKSNDLTTGLRVDGVHTSYCVCNRLPLLPAGVQPEESSPCP